MLQCFQIAKSFFFILITFKQNNLCLRNIFSSILVPTVVHIGLLLRIKLLMKLLSVALMSLDGNHRLLSFYLRCFHIQTCSFFISLYLHDFFTFNHLFSFTFQRMPIISSDGSILHARQVYFNH